MRSISLEGCSPIGSGAKATVYRWKPDTIVKVYHNGGDPALIRQEQALSRLAFVNGLPTAISFDIVRVGSSYASMF